MKVSAAMVFTLLLAITILPAAVASTASYVDWESLANLTKETADLIREGMDYIMDHGGKYFEITKELEGIAGTCTLDGTVILGLIAVEVLQKQLTVDNARDYFHKLQIVLERAHVALQEPMLHVGPDTVRDIENKFHEVLDKVDKKRNSIIILVKQ